uniref:Uncharacterized protein n=1 Tax=Sphaerodactylus townsendi TaxID=933632 RepID=A0ACB8EM85_9SAUR
MDSGPATGSTVSSPMALQTAHMDQTPQSPSPMALQTMDLSATAGRARPQPSGPTDGLQDPTTSPNPGPTDSPGPTGGEHEAPCPTDSPWTRTRPHCTDSPDQDSTATALPKAARLKMGYSR